MIHPAEADARAKRQERRLLAALLYSIAVLLAALTVGAWAVMSADMKRPPLTPETLVHE